MDNDKVRVIVDFASSFNTVEDYIRGIKKAGVLSELQTFGVTAPAWMSIGAVKQMYALVLRDYLER